MDACLRETNARSGVRPSRVVLAPRRWRQVLQGVLQGDGGKKARFTRESAEKAVNPIVQGMPERFGEPVVTTLVCFFHLRTRLRVRRAPGIPCALSRFERDSCNDSVAILPRENDWLRHCEEP
jgi:hypothetical protein